MLFSFLKMHFWQFSPPYYPSSACNTAYPTNYSHQIQIAHIKYKILTSNTNYSHQIQITHIKYKLLTSKTRLNGQRSENESYVQFSLGLDPTAILFLHVVLSSGCFAATAEEMSTIPTFAATAEKVS